MKVDQIKMEQVLLNLISNAKDAIGAKEGGHGGKISVTSRRDEGFAVIEFSDDGCGMDENARAKVFDALPRKSARARAWE